MSLLNQADKLNIPYRFHHRNAQLIAYCRTRIEVYNLIYKTIDERTYKYRPAILAGNQKIAAMLKELKEHEAEKE
ncbi:hypothetical protein [Mucilaginibacter sp.]|uniref:hypothetical protein n=1 Tax=Mucilaginibacter sp. TaxID=1882438 RepID=UPI0035BBD15C